jgi:hypothetical protein
MQRRTTFAAVALSATVTVLAGCGGSSSGTGSSNNTGTSSTGGSNSSSSTPTAELTNAVDKLSSGSTLTATLKLGASESQLKSFVSSQGASIPPAAASALAGASISIEAQAPSGKTLADGSSGSAANVSIDVGGKSLISFRDVSQVIYIQVDVKDLLNTIGKSSTFQEIQGASAQLPAFVQDLLAGKWVSLPLSTLKGLTGAAGASTPSSPSASQQNAVVGVLKSILSKDVTVTRTSSGSTDDLTLTGNTKTIANDLVSGVSSAVPSLGALSSSAGNPPNKTVTLHATVSGGVLTSLSVDLAQFAKKSTSASFPLELDFAQSGASISAPSGATPVDTSTLTQLLGAFGGGGLGG